MFSTCKTFETEAEAKAFMLGFIVGTGASGVGAHFDIQELECVLIDCFTNHDTEIWLEAVADYNAGFPNGH
jgi:hypothetical protein